MRTMSTSDSHASALMQPPLILIPPQTAILAKVKTILDLARDDPTKDDQIKVWVRVSFTLLDANDIIFLSIPRFLNNRLPHPDRHFPPPGPAYRHQHLGGYLPEGATGLGEALIRVCRGMKGG